MKKKYFWLDLGSTVITVTVFTLVTGFGVFHWQWWAVMMPVAIYGTVQNFIGRNKP